MGCFPLPEMWSTTPDNGGDARIIHYLPTTTMVGNPTTTLMVNLTTATAVNLQYNIRSNSRNDYGSLAMTMVMVMAMNMTMTTMEMRTVTMTMTMSNYVRRC